MLMWLILMMLICITLNKTEMSITRSLNINSNILHFGEFAVKKLDHHSESNFTNLDVIGSAVVVSLQVFSPLDVWG